MHTSNRTVLRRIAITACFGAVTLFAACSDFLNPKPNDVLAPENFYKSATDAVAAVNGVYEQTKWAHWLSF